MHHATEADSARIAAAEAALSDGRPAEAASLTARLIRQGIDNAAVFVLRVRALAAAGHSEEALAAAGDGLSRHPHAPRLWVERGKLLSRSGRAAEALSAFDRALTEDPAQLEAVKGVLSYRKLAPDDPRLVAVNALIRNPQASSARRTKAHFILGQVWMEAEEPDIAFAHYRSANDLMAAGQDPAALEYRFATGAFDLDRAMLNSPRPRLAPCPALLIAGLPRSGKTLAEGLLARCPELRPGGELAILSRYCREFDWSRGGQAAARDMLAQQDSPLAARYAAAARGARWVTDTSPPTLFRLGIMAFLHPDVPLVLCHRDPQDLIAAIYMKQFRRGNLFSTRLDTLGRAVARAERMARHWCEVLPLPPLVLAYEETVGDPDGTADQLAAHAGLPKPAPSEPPPATMRLHPARSTDGRPDPALIGFARPFARHLAPAMAAYHAEVARLQSARP
jgi:tetratricopeptide (TPR) repeat protein